MDRAARLFDDAVTKEVITNELPLLAVFDLSFASACPYYDQFAPEPPDVPLDGGGVPILVIGNNADPVTSIDESQKFAIDTLSNGYLVRTSHRKHVVYPENQCVNRHVHRALIEGVYPAAREISCAREDPEAEPETAAAVGQPVFFLGPCAEIYECGLITVPADYRDPEAGIIIIQFAVHRATSPEKRIGYLFVNPGGPGVPGRAFAFSAPFGQYADEIVERFDIVGFDPRGVGASEPSFACGDPGEQLALRASVEDDVIDTPEEIAAGEAAANLCIQSMGRVGGLLHSAYVANDMDEIRKGLGVEQISYLGYSYGSALGVWYATLFPQSVRAMVVDGASNPVGSTTTEQEGEDEENGKGIEFEAKLGEVLAACADPECPIYNDGDPVGYYYQATAKLDLVIALADNNPIAGAMSMIGALYSEADWPLLWQGLFELNENDDPSILFEFARKNLGSELSGASFTGHVNCLDQWALHPEFDRAARLAAVDMVADHDDDPTPLLSATVRSTSAAVVCDYYDQFAPEPLEGPLDGRGVPILVVGNHNDPITSYSESEEFATGVLSNGYLVETRHPTHTVYPQNQCVNNHVHRALIDGVYPSEGRVYCERE